MKKTVILLTTLCLCFHLFTVSLCAAPSVSARSAVVIDAKTGKILFEFLEHMFWVPVAAGAGCFIKFTHKYPSVLIIGAIIVINLISSS